MQVVSKTYRESMKAELRERSYVRVEIGMRNQRAQENAFLSDDICYLSGEYDPFAEDATMTGQYATAEQDYTKVDGSMYFPPRSSQVTWLGGIISSEVLGVIEIQFHQEELDIKGLTIDFGEQYPVDFDIVSNSNTLEVTGNTWQRFETDFVFREVTSIKIIAKKMRNGLSRLRIFYMMMGVCIRFDNHTIISMSEKSFVSPIAESMPSTDFTVTVNNVALRYDIENRNSAIHYFETGQKVKVYYGYELPDGMEWLSGSTLKLKEWSADEEQASFTAVDRFAYLEDTYFKGRYYETGISLYDLAVEVLQDASIQSEEYWLDPYLKKVIVKNPLPIVKHKEALQIIANAGRCVLTQDREGCIVLQSSFVPDVSISSDSAERYSDLNLVLSGGDVVHYASGNKNFTKLNQRYFVPKDAPYLQTGYVSHVVANEQGAFLQNPSITLTLESAFRYVGMYLLFGGNPPQEMQITTYNEGKEISHTTVTEINQKTVVNYDFGVFDVMQIEFTKGAEQNRVVVDFISFGEVTDYILQYENDLTAIPKGTQLEKVKELHLIRTLYNKGSTRTEIAKQDIRAVPNEMHTMTFKDAVSDVSCTCEGIPVEIIESGAYYAVVKFGGVQALNTKLILNGCKYENYSLDSVTKIHATGSTKEWKNPLVSDLEHATDLAEWISAYLKSDKEYELSYRGDPRIDANDSFYLERREQEKVEIRAYEHSIRFNGALSGSMKARKVL